MLGLRIGTYQQGNNMGKILIAVLLMFAMIFIMALILALPTVLLWNWLMPDLFGLRIINIWEALGINILSGILFKSSSSTSRKESAE
jgi:hypothetical protein